MDFYGSGNTEGKYICKLWAYKKWDYRSHKTCLFKMFHKHSFGHDGSPDWKQYTEALPKEWVDDKWHVSSRYIIREATDKEKEKFMVYEI